MEDADTTLTKQTGNSVAYDIAADKNGDALKDKLRGLLVGDIGDEKATVFMEGGQWPFAEELSNFLEQKRQIEISWTPQTGAPGNTYNVRVNYGSGGLYSTSGVLQPEYRKYLPADVKP